MSDNSDQPFRPIGSLMGPGASSPGIMGSATIADTTRSKSSAITTSPEGRSLRTSGPAGGPGCSARAISIVREAAADPRMAKDMLVDPARLLTPSTQSAIAAEWADGDLGDGYGWDGFVANYTLAAQLVGADLEEASDLIRAMLLPAGEDFVIVELARLRAVTISRDIETDLALVLTAYAATLCRYPADVVADALHSWHGKFWPALAEIEEKLNRSMRPRMALLAGLERGYIAPPPPSPEWLPPSAGEKEAVAAYLEAHGFDPALATTERPIEAEPMTTADHRRVIEECAARPKIPAPL
jgi:hypothetical protein